MVGWGRVYIDCLSASNIVGKTRPYRPSWRVSPTIYVGNQQYNKPALPNERLFYGDKIMKYDPNKHHRSSIRLPAYDYRTPGAYFITICSWQRECLFGEVINDKMQLSPYGKTVLFNWSILPKRYQNVA